MKSWRDFCTPALTIETDMESPSHFSGCHSIEVFITATPEPAYGIKVNGLAG